MLSPDHFTSDPLIGLGKDVTSKYAGKNAHSPQNMQTPGDANGVHS